LSTQRDWGRELVSVLFWVVATLIGFFYLLFCAGVIIVHLGFYLAQGLKMAWDWGFKPPIEYEYRGK